MHLRPAMEGDEPVFELRLDSGEWHALNKVPERLTEVLTAPERNQRVIDRLFPPTHLQDPAAEREHRRLIGDTLFEERRESLRRFEAVLERAVASRKHREVRLTVPEVHLLIHVLNDLRLLLGCQLEIEDNEWSIHGPRKLEDVADFVFLLLVTSIQQDLIEALEE